MLTVYGEGRGFRVVWMLEEMGIPYRLRPVDLLHDLEHDTEFLEINPAGFIPALKDESVVMVESIAILEYLAARYGPTSLTPSPTAAAFPLYQQFLHLGEAGLAMPVYFVVVSKFGAPADERDNFGARLGRELFDSRRRLVWRQLEQTPFVAGEQFTAADISVTYAFHLAQFGAGLELTDLEHAYLDRVTKRDGYRRAMDACPATRAWATSNRG